MGPSDVAPSQPSQETAGLTRTADASNLIKLSRRPAPGAECSELKPEVARDPAASATAGGITRAVDWCSLPAEINARVFKFVGDGPHGPKDLMASHLVSRTWRAGVQQSLVGRPSLSREFSRRGFAREPTVATLLAQLQYLPHIDLPHVRVPWSPVVMRQILGHLSDVGENDLRLTRSLTWEFDHYWYGGDEVTASTLENAFRNVHAKGQPTLTTAFKFSMLRGEQVEPWLDAIGRLAIDAQSKLAEVRVDKVGGGTPLGFDGVQLLARAAGSPNNPLRIIDLGQIPITADDMHALLEGAASKHSKVVVLEANNVEGVEADALVPVLASHRMGRVRVTLNTLGRDSATALGGTLGDAHRLESLWLRFTPPAGTGSEQALANGLLAQLTNPRCKLRDLHLETLTDAAPVVQAVVSALHPPTGAPAPRQFVKLTIAQPRERLTGVGTHLQRGTLAGVIADRECPLRELQLIGCNLRINDIMALIEAAVQPGSPLTSITLTNNLLALTPAQLAPVRTLHARKPDMGLFVDGYSRLEFES